MTVREALREIINFWFFCVYSILRDFFHKIEVDSFFYVHFERDFLYKIEVYIIRLLIFVCR